MKGALRRKVLPEGRTERETLPIKDGIFAAYDPKVIVASIRKRAVMGSHRRFDPLRSALAMLNFYIDRTGSRLGRQRREILKEARRELHRDLRSDRRE